MLSAALGYAGRGWRVFPLHTPLDGGCTCRKRGSCTQSGKHPRTRNGVKDASAHPGQIEQWWSKWPDANIGIATGKDSGLMVLTWTTRTTDEAATISRSRVADHRVLPQTLTATTGNGEHLFFAYPGVEVGNSASKLAENVDVRGDGGSVVAAPSLHANGKRYAWREPELALAQAPRWLLTV